AIRRKEEGKKEYQVETSVTLRIIHKVFAEDSREAEAIAIDKLEQNTYYEKKPDGEMWSVIPNIYATKCEEI
ncbi:unnamed protein product, partial [marine sediment metagenome]